MSSDTQDSSPFRPRKFGLLAACVAVVLGAADVATGGTELGLLLVGLGLAAIIGYLSQRSRERRGLPAATEYHVAKAYAFFAVCAIGGAVVFGLAILGVMKHPAVYAVFGLAALAIGGYVLVSSVRDKRRSGP